MHEITRQVRQMYELHPYPLKGRGLVSNLHPDLMISYVQRRPGNRPLTMLDAGCGTGSSSLGSALYNPHWRVTAIDLNRTALQQVREEAEHMELKNLSVREVDMQTLDGLPVPPGGFDFILCSGSLPCSADPLLALRKLAGCLAPDGVMRIMVYNRLGRHGIYRFVEAMDCLHGDRQAIPERLELARALMAGLAPGPVNSYPWTDAATVDDHEFVDRYLNVHDLSYNIPEFFQLLADGGWSFLRWYEPEHWKLSSVLSDPTLCERLAHLPATALYSFIELVSHRPQLDAIVVGPQGEARGPYDPASQEMLSLNPQLILCMRAVPGRNGMEHLDTHLSLRQHAARPASKVEKLIMDQLAPAPATFAELCQGLTLQPEQVQSMIDAELLYRHP